MLFRSDILGDVGVLRVVIAGEISRAERREDQNGGKNCENREIPAGVQQPKYIARSGCLAGVGGLLTQQLFHAFGIQHALTQIFQLGHRQRRQFFGGPIGQRAEALQN